MRALQIASWFLYPLTSLAATKCQISPDCPIPKNVDLHNATILKTTYYDIGTFNESGVSNEVAFCEVQASVAYSSNATLNFALWLPDADSYSSRFMAVGNGGFGGVIGYQDMLFELNNGMGLAVAGGDAGHLASDNGGSTGAPGMYTPFLHDEDQVKAWLKNAISIFTPAAKVLTEAFYSRKLEYSYFRGCSAGGAQGFSLAEFHPDLFDGIIAGGPTNWFTGNMLSFLHGAQQTNTSETFLSQELLDFVQSHVIAACDLNDGVEDKLVENPLKCDFDISLLACTGKSTSEVALCLTSAQFAAMKAIYRGPYRSDKPEENLYPGLTLASEAGWSLPQVSGALSNAFTVPILQNLVYNDLSYDPATFNWGLDVEVLEERAGPLINAVSTDLSKFRESGGKMIVFAGWADPNIAPEGTLQHVKALTEGSLGKGTTIAENDFVKLVMIPGGGHCGSNIAKYPYVPAKYDFSPAIAKWVEDSSAPSEGIRSWDPINGDERSRRLCTWPQVAKYDGKGDVDDWGSYTCE
ncbi:tannase and feruloyl esterase [Sarocladium strictum]